jgi:hypothetical protein
MTARQLPLRVITPERQQLLTRAAEKFRLASTGVGAFGCWHGRVSPPVTPVTLRLVSTRGGTRNRPQASINPFLIRYRECPHKLLQGIMRRQPIEPFKGEKHNFQIPHNLLK